MKPKKPLALIGLALVAVIAYQVGTFVVQYARVQSALDSLLPNFAEWGEEEFKLRLCDEARELGVEVLPANIEVRVDRLANSLQVEFSYTRELQVLVVSFHRTVRIRGYKKDLDI